MASNGLGILPGGRNTNEEDPVVIMGTVIENIKKRMTLWLIILVAILGCCTFDLFQLTPKTSLPVFMAITPSLTFNPEYGVWIDPPTYVTEGISPYLFKLKFKNAGWELIPYYKGHKLVNRTISGCEITPIVGGDLPEGYTVEHSSKAIGKNLYGTNFVYKNNHLEFVTYITKVDKYLTGFSVENIETCISNAEIVLATFQGINNPIHTPRP